MTYKPKFIIKDKNGNLIQSLVKKIDTNTQLTFEQLTEQYSGYSGYSVESYQASGQNVSGSDVVLHDHWFITITLALN